MNKILGIEVDAKTFQEISARKFVLHAEGDKVLPLAAIELRANSEDYKVYENAVWVEARQILESVRNELKERKFGKGENKTMKHAKFQEYIEDLRKISEEAATERKKLQEGFDAAAQRWNENSEKFRSNPDKLTLAKAAWLGAKKDFEDNLNELRTATDEKIKAVRESFQEHLNDFYSLSGERLDDSAIKLLKSGISFTSDEMLPMLEKYISNVTMLRLLCDFCASNQISTPEIQKYSSLIRSGGTAELTLFDRAAEAVGNVVSGDEKWARSWENSRVRILDEIASKFAEMPIAPGA